MLTLFSSKYIVISSVLKAHRISLLDKFVLMRDILHSYFEVTPTYGTGHWTVKIFIYFILLLKMPLDTQANSAHGSCFDSNLNSPTIKIHFLDNSRKDNIDWVLE